MAAQIACDLCGEEPAAMMQTNVANGDVIAVGDACMITFYLAGLVALTDGIPAEIAANYNDLTAALVANMAPSMTQLAQSSGPRRPRKPKADASPTQDAAPAPDADSASASTNSDAGTSGEVTADSIPSGNGDNTRDDDAPPDMVLRLGGRDPGLYADGVKVE